MGGITEAMLKRRAEHNDGVLYTLEELVLQEEGLDKIDRILGNPCQDVPDYRHFVIATLPSLKRLDGLEVKPSERIRARQMIDSVVQKLKCENIIGHNDTASKKGTVSAMNEKGQVIRDYTPATRLAEHAELEEMRSQSKPEKEVSKESLKKSRRHHGFDPLPSEGRLYQKNEGGWNFRLLESNCKSKVLLDVPVGRYMDISLIDIDVQPTWVRILVKGKLLQLSLPEEVNPDGSIAQRSATTGNLLISMPKASSNARVNVQKCYSSPVFYTSQEREQIKEKSQARSKVNAVKNAEMVNDSIEQPVKKELVSKVLNEGPEIEQEQLLDELTFDDLPALE